MKRKPLSISSVPKHKAHLIETGWVLTHPEDPKCYHWVDPRDAGRVRRLGGNCFEQAISIHADYERYDAGLSVYFSRPNQFGYGYEIVEQKAPKRTKDRVILGRHSDEKVAESYIEALTKDPSTFVLSDYDHDYHKIVVLKEKHGDRYLAAPTLDDFYSQCLSIVKSRHEEECWYDYDSDIPESPALTKEQVKALKDGCIKQAAEEEWERYEQAIKQAESNKEERTMLKLALAGDGLMAALFLKGRSDGEYEGFELEDMEMAP